MKRPELRRTLEDRLEKELEAAARDLQKDKRAVPSKATLERVEALDRLLAVLPRGVLPERLAALVIFTLSLLLVAWAWQTPISEAGFAAEVRASEIALTPGELPLDLGGLIGGRQASLAGLSWIGQASDSPAQESAFAGARLEVPGRDARLVELRVEQASRLDLAHTGQTLVLRLHEAELTGVIRFEPPRGGAGGGEEPQTETVRFERLPGSPIPVSLVFTAPRMQPIATLSVSFVDFLTETGERSSESPFDSSILRGQVTLLDIPRTHQLARGDVLTLGESSRLQKVELTLAPTLTARLRGVTDRLESGPEGRQRDLTPSMLEYLAQSRRPALLWGALVFVSGVLWNLRKVLRLQA